MFQLPMSSPQIIRMFGLLDFGISLLLLVDFEFVCSGAPKQNATVLASQSRMFPCSFLFKRPHVKDHACDGGHSDRQQKHRRYQRKRGRIGGLCVDEPLFPHRLPQTTQANHVLHVVGDAPDQHRDAKRDERQTEIARRRRATDEVLVPELSEKLVRW